jgi:P27 family predicted phage terminase small subunit
MKAPVKPSAPAHLRPATRQWWAAVTERWELEAHHVQLLTLAAEAWDRSNDAREQLARDGLTVTTKAGGPRLHPCVKVKEAAEIAYARLLRELDLDLDAPPAAARPTALRSMK